MTLLNFYKTTELPINKQPYGLYFVDSADPNIVDLYIVNETATATKRLINQDDIQSLINDAIADIPTVIDWTEITNKPISTPSQIDNTVSVAHTHLNKNQLDLINQDVEGNLTYNGQPIKSSNFALNVAWG